eukprot:jgi/Ulvmu1/9811/UM056_0051.1
MDSPDFTLRSRLQWSAEPTSASSQVYVIRATGKATLSHASSPSADVPGVIGGAKDAVADMLAKSDVVSSGPANGSKEPPQNVRLTTAAWYKARPRLLAAARQQLSSCLSSDSDDDQSLERSPHHTSNSLMPVTSQVGQSSEHTRNAAFNSQPGPGQQCHVASIRHLPSLEASSQQQTPSRGHVQPCCTQSSPPRLLQTPGHLQPSVPVAVASIMKPSQMCTPTTASAVAPPERLCLCPHCPQAAAAVVAHQDAAATPPEPSSHAPAALTSKLLRATASMHHHMQKLHAMVPDRTSCHSASRRSSPQTGIVRPSPHPTSSPQPHTPPLAKQARYSAARTRDRHTLSPGSLNTRHQWQQAPMVSVQNMVRRLVPTSAASTSDSSGSDDSGRSQMQPKQSQITQSHPGSAAPGRLHTVAEDACKRDRCYGARSGHTGSAVCPAPCSPAVRPPPHCGHSAIEHWDRSCSPMPAALCLCSSQHRSVRWSPASPVDSPPCKEDATRLARSVLDSSPCEGHATRLARSVLDSSPCEGHAGEAPPLQHMSLSGGDGRSDSAVHARRTSTVHSDRDDECGPVGDAVEAALAALRERMSALRVRDRRLRLDMCQTLRDPRMPRAAHTAAAPDDGWVDYSCSNKTDARGCYAHWDPPLAAGHPSEYLAAADDDSGGRSRAEPVSWEQQQHVTKLGHCQDEGSPQGHVVPGASPRSGAACYPDPGVAAASPSQASWQVAPHMRRLPLQKLMPGAAAACQHGSPPAASMQIVPLTVLAQGHACDARDHIGAGPAVAAAFGSSVSIALVRSRGSPAAGSSSAALHQGRCGGGVSVAHGSANVRARAVSNNPFRLSRPCSAGSVETAADAPARPAPSTGHSTCQSRGGTDCTDCEAVQQKQPGSPEAGGDPEEDEAVLVRQTNSGAQGEYAAYRRGRQHFAVNAVQPTVRARITLPDLQLSMEAELGCAERRGTDRQRARMPGGGQEHSARASVVSCLEGVALYDAGGVPLTLEQVEEAFVTAVLQRRTEGGSPAGPLRVSGELIGGLRQTAECDPAAVPSPRSPLWLASGAGAAGLGPERPRPRQSGAAAGAARACVRSPLGNMAQQRAAGHCNGWGGGPDEATAGSWEPHDNLVSVPRSAHGSAAPALAPCAAAASGAQTQQNTDAAGLAQAKSAPFGATTGADMWRSVHRDAVPALIPGRVIAPQGKFTPESQSPVSLEARSRILCPECEGPIDTKSRDKEGLEPCPHRECGGLAQMAEGSAPLPARPDARCRTYGISGQQPQNKLPPTCEALDGRSTSGALGNSATPMGEAGQPQTRRGLHGPEVKEQEGLQPCSVEHGLAAAPMQERPQLAPVLCTPRMDSAGDRDVAAAGPRRGVAARDQQRDTDAAAAEAAAADAAAESPVLRAMKALGYVPQDSQSVQDARAAGSGWIIPHPCAADSGRGMCDLHTRVLVPALSPLAPLVGTGEACAATTACAGGSLGAPEHVGTGGNEHLTGPQDGSVHEGPAVAGALQPQHSGTQRGLRPSFDGSCQDHVKDVPSRIDTSVTWGRSLEQLEAGVQANRFEQDLSQGSTRRGQGNRAEGDLRSAEYGGMASAVRMKEGCCNGPTSVTQGRHVGVQESAIQTDGQDMADIGNQTSLEQFTASAEVGGTPAAFTALPDWGRPASPRSVGRLIARFSGKPGTAGMGRTTQRRTGMTIKLRPEQHVQQGKDMVFLTLFDHEGVKARLEDLGGMHADDPLTLEAMPKMPTHPAAVLGPPDLMNKQESGQLDSRCDEAVPSADRPGVVALSALQHCRNEAHGNDGGRLTCSAGPAADTMAGQCPDNPRGGYSSGYNLGMARQKPQFDIHENGLFRFGSGSSLSTLGECQVEPQPD